MPIPAHLTPEERAFVLSHWHLPEKQFDQELQLFREKHPRPEPEPFIKRERSDHAEGI